MKKLLVFLSLFLLGTCALMAVITDNFQFSSSTGTYQEITGTAIPALTADDALSGAIDIGFTFPYGLATFTQVKISSNGWIGLGTTQTSSQLTNALVSTTVVPVLAPLWDDTEVLGTVQYQTTGTAPTRIFTVQWSNVAWNYTGTGGFNFQVKMYENGKIEYVYGASGTATSPSGSIGINMAPGGTDNYMSITPGTPPTYSTTTANTAVATMPASGTIYTFDIPVAVANDLAVLSLTGNLTPSVGTATTYVVSVRNPGSSNQTTYNVKLYNAANTELASIAGPAIVAGAILPVNIAYTPTAVGPMSIYAKVVLEGDQNALNNQSAPLALNVQPAGIQAITIGNETTTLNTIPIDMYYQSSLSETIFLASELNTGGQITGLSWYNNFITTTLQNMPTKIWLGETTQTNLTAGWIPSTQLTSVFDGNVSYPSGPNGVVTVTFTTPYTYAGGNLVVMANRPMDTEYYNTGDVFYVSEGGAGRTREYHNDTTASDPAAPLAGNVITKYPNTTFYVLAGGGFITGTVTAGGSPLAGAVVRVGDGVQSSTTDANGVYHLNYVPEGTHPVIAEKHGYASVTQQVAVVTAATVTQNFTLALLPQVTVTGHVVANTAPTVGIQGATITLTGYEPYSATTNATGDFSITGVFASQTYNYVVAATGFQPTAGTVVVGTTNVNMGTLMVTEVMFPAGQVVAAVAGSDVQLTWAAPDPNAVEITEDFEGTFVPEGWSQTILNTDPPNTLGVPGTWAQFGTVALTPAVPPHGGAMQVGLWWSYNHQDEWLITPQFTCPPNADLTFWSYCNQGSPNADHYYVKVSTDNGGTWTALWDASTLPVLANAYATPYTIPLAAYAGQQIKLAWQGIDGPTMDGLWYVWFIDDVRIGGPTQMITFGGADFTTKSASSNKPTVTSVPQAMDPTMPTRLARSESSRPIAMPTPREDDRPVTGYNVARLHVGEEATPGVWTTLGTVTTLNYTDTAWAGLPTGSYKWAVRAIYTGEVLAAPAFSNVLVKVISGTISGTVTSAASGNPVVGATVTAGTVTATTSATGSYTMTVPTGTYTVTATANAYMPGSQANVIVNANPAVTTVNFALSASAIIFTESFETYDDFALSFAPWTVNDVDGSTTYGMTGTTWPGSGEAQAFIIFNPTTTVPAIATGGEAHTGTKWAACFAATTPPNNDWIITPQIHIGATGILKFWARSYTAQYGLERFKVGVSTTGTLPANFTFVSTTYTEAPVAWTEYTYNLAPYANQTVYLGLNCVSNDAFILMLDDFSLDSPGGYVVANTDPIANPTLTSLGGNYPNPFNPNTYIKYSVKQPTPVSITIYNVKGQQVKTLVNEVATAGDHTVLWNGTDDSNRGVSSGVYFYKMNAGKYSSTKKMILMK